MGYAIFCSVFFLFMKYTFLRMMGYENIMFQPNTKVFFHLLPRVAFYFCKMSSEVFYLGIVNLYPHFKADRPCKLQF